MIEMQQLITNFNFLWLINVWGAKRIVPSIFLYSYEVALILYNSLCSRLERNSISVHINFSYRYIDDVLSINNPDFQNNLGQMYPAELEIKDTTEGNTSISHLDLLLPIRRDGRALPLMPNETISTSISQTFLS